MTDPRTTEATGRGTLVLLLLVAFTAIANPFIQSFGQLNSDVSFLTWTAGEVMGPKVFGIDIYEVNPPLAFIIYWPAALLALAIGYALAIKLWVTFLACLSIVVFWQACDASLRLPLTIALALFIALAIPGQFGQREQIAFMLTAPYAAGACRSRGWAVASGVMAGIGFAIKPYFLIALVLVFATRRRLRTEEWVIAATGAVYASALLLFFQPYLFQFLPLARATYWAARLDVDATYELAGYMLLSAIPFALAGASQPAARGLIAACFGFIIAAFIQLKGYSYHFHAALGFLTLFLVARAYNPRRLVAICAMINLALLGYTLRMPTLDWFARRDDSLRVMQDLLPEIDQSRSYLSLTRGSFPGMPTALFTRARYEAIGIWPIFISAALDPSAGPDLQERARQLTFGQANAELRREPELVIVEQRPTLDGWARPQFDLLSWFKTDPAFREAWKAYRYDKTVDGYDLYRRVP